MIGSNTMNKARTGQERNYANQNYGWYNGPPMQMFSGQQEGRGHQEHQWNYGDQGNQGVQGNQWGDNQGANGFSGESPRKKHGSRYIQSRIITISQYLSRPPKSQISAVVILNHG